METEKKIADNAGKRIWHTPELRKNIIADDTQLGIFQTNDGEAGTSAPG